MQCFHWFRVTHDGRIIFGGRKVPIGNVAMDREYEAATFAKQEKDLRAFFPALKDVKVTHRWGGTISGTIDLVPHIGWLDGGKRFLRISGCWGHGVAMAHLNGQLVSDLIRGTDSELTEFWLVDHKPRSWPPGPIHTVGASAAIGALVAYDEWMLRKAERNATDPERKRAFGALRG